MAAFHGFLRGVAKEQGALGIHINRVRKARMTRPRVEETQKTPDRDESVAHQNARTKSDTRGKQSHAPPRGAGGARATPSPAQDDNNGLPERPLSPANRDPRI